MDEAVGSAFAQARDPEIALLGQVVEPGETEIAQISQDEAAWRKSFQQEEDIDFAIGQDIRTQFQAQPLLATQVKESGQFAHLQQLAVSRFLAQVRGQAAHALQGGFIQGYHLTRKGGQGQSWSCRAQTQKRRELGKQLLQARGALAQEAIAHSHGCDRRRGKGAQPFPDQHAPDVGIALDATQHPSH